MKKLFALIFLLSLITVSIQAQVIPPVKYTFATAKITATTYATFLSVPADVAAFQVALTKDSGTVGGYVIVEATVDGTNWLRCSSDTLALTNVSTVQSKVWDISNFLFRAASYRLKIVPSGGGTRLLPLAYYLRKKTVVFNTY